MPLFARLFPRRVAAPALAGPLRFRPRLDALGDRITPALGFAAAAPFAVGTGPNALAVADFNGDGRADVATADFGSGAGNTVSVLRSVTAPAGVAAFAAKQSFNTGTGTNIGPFALTVGDINGDGRADLVVANFGANTVAVLLNTTAVGGTTLSFAAAVTFAVGTAPSAVAVADFNGDGRPDVATADYTSASPTVSVLRSTTAVGATAATFAAATTFAVAAGPYALVAGDFNTDGRPDLAVAQYAGGTGNTVSVLRNTTTVGSATLTFAGYQTLIVGTGPIALAAADLNGDGRLDLAAANYQADTVSVLRNATASGATALTFAAPQTVATGAGPGGVTAADFNGDGKADLAVAAFDANTVQVFANTGAVGAAAPTFAAPVAVAVGTAPSAVAALDVNADGLIDLATADAGAGTVSVVRSTTTGTAVTGPVSVGQFGTTGVWQLNRSTNTWAQLTASNADALAVSPNGRVVGSFGPNGVYYYTPTVGWVQLSNVQASAVAIDPLGNPFVSFAGYGVYAYWGWQMSPTPVATLLLSTSVGANALGVGGNGNVWVSFPGYGLYRDGITAADADVQINPNAVTALAVGVNGDVAASFATFGTYRWKVGASGFTSLDTSVATALAVDAYGAVAANIGGNSVKKYHPFSGGATLSAGSAAVPSLAMDLFGNVFATFTGYGVFEYRVSASGWTTWRTTDAGILRTGG